MSGGISGFARSETTPKPDTEHHGVALRRRRVISVAKAPLREAEKHQRALRCRRIACVLVEIEGTVRFNVMVRRADAAKARRALDP